MSAFKAPILMYHHVERMPLDPPARFAGGYISRKEFSRQLDSLTKRGIQTLTLTQALRGLLGGKSTRKSVVLTFDDGCTCFSRNVVPELEKRSMTATVFVLSGHLGGTNRWDQKKAERREDLLDGAALRLLADRGIEIGCHGRSHSDLTHLDERDLAVETGQSRKDLEAILDLPVETFCYPYGHFDQASREAVERAGFLGAVSVHGLAGVSQEDRFALPRVGIDPGESAVGFRLKTTGAYRNLRHLWRLGFLKALRAHGPLS